MVGVINPAKGQSIDTQKSAAINAGYQLAPDQPWPAEGSSPKLQPSSISPPSKKPNSQQVSGGTIAGIVIGVLLAIALAAALVFFLWRARQKNTQKDPGEDSMSVTGTDVEEQTVPLSMRYEPGLLNSPRTVESSTLPQRKKSILRTFYRYPSIEKPLVAPKDHPTYRTDSI